MAVTQPPSLPYIRDEASTSQQLSAYPSYPAHEEYEAERDLGDHLEEEDAEQVAATQYWSTKRHSSRQGKSKTDEETALPWRLRSRLKTVNGGLFLCLNIGVDPPDIVKTNPAAKTECWIDPTSLPSNKAIDAIGRSLQQQFETLNPKVRYKPAQDPAIEETKKVCVGLRKNARDERTLFYYNGHGVPKPTSGGEIWVFNKSYTQYIPVSLVDLQEWLGSPCIYVWECSGAGSIITNFKQSARRRDEEIRQANAASNGGVNHDLPGSLFSESIHLAPCSANQVLPMSPDLPADLFTCCLTSPIETALRFFVQQDPLKRNIHSSSDDPRSRLNVDMVMKIPGDLKDRRTPLGELQWIFTAVTDTIAWLSFPRETFMRLFRQDLLVAALFRNYLLAQRIMTTYHCTPISHPELPSTHNHPLWDSWDLAVDACLAQLPDLLDQEAAREAAPQLAIPPLVYKPSSFFAQHLQAFEVWLDRGGGSVNNNLAKQIVRKEPEQLPIVLQVLLSQAHRLRALILLSQFVDLGPWAVNMALSIGIFPYVQKLLQSPAAELKPVLIFIWARILAVDKSCQMDLLKENGYNYFAQILAPYPVSGQPLVIPNANEHRAMCAFILAMLCRNFRAGQTACLSYNVFDHCLARLQEDDWLLRAWCLLCIAQMWADNDEGKALGISHGRQEIMMQALHNTAAEVRAAALYAFGTFLGASSAPINSAEPRGGGGMGAQISMAEHEQLELEAGLAYACMMAVKEDASPMVRKELVVVISCVVREWRGWFVAAAWCYYEQEAALEHSDAGSDDEPDIVQEALEAWVSSEDLSPEAHQVNLTLLSSFKTLFETLMDLSVDPHPEVAGTASTVVDYIVALLLDSSFNRVPDTALKGLNRPKVGARFAQASQAEPPRSPSNSTHLAKSDGLSPVNGGLKRNTSFGGALRSLASLTGLLPAEIPEETQAPVETVTRTDVEQSQYGAQFYKSPYPDSTHQRVLPDGVARGGVLGTRVRHQVDPTAVTAVSVIEALVEEDMERLRQRRLRGTQAGGDADGRLANNGLSRPNDLGLGMVAAEVKDDVVPLRSGFFDWAVEYFREPQMKKPDTDEPGSVSYNQQAWRHSRNEMQIQRSRVNEDHAAHHRWDTDAGTIHNDAWPLQLAFHSHEPLLAVTDDEDKICIWDWTTRTKINKFSNHNLRGSSISSVHFINETASSLMLTASTEGSIRVWRDYDIPGETNLATTFRAVSDIFPVGHHSGVLTSWEQRRGHLLVGGDMRVIRLWDAHVERHVRDIPTQAGANLTAIAADEPDGNVFVAGFGDGVVRLFDKRIDDAAATAIRTWRQHHTWIQSVHIQHRGYREVVTGSMNGEVRIWDSRVPDTPLYEHNVQPQGLQALAVHSGAPVFATTSAPTPHSTRQRLVVQGFATPEKPKRLSAIDIALAPTTYQAHQHSRASFMPSAASLVFHPVEMVLAASGYDSSGNVRLFKCRTPEGPLIENGTYGANGTANGYRYN
ncbi:Target of rapamycin complex 1 subunit mip1 [Vanrija pseudolonga]|uniref:Target of rapamycin complex 1 subunit mip1 n=1 Tax=Vanrija pseudolonga TaxID=143232 RepID=A0AAF0Y0N7_9TREE|nr:Target of rapamycin complex 1 subunit mip1 [Vanrija pseudolonga]